jgi:ribosomal subunit interface protein
VRNFLIVQDEAAPYEDHDERFWRAATWSGLTTMKIEIRGHKLELSAKLRAHAERRLGFALGRFATRIGRVIVRFSEIGADKRCQIDVSLLPLRVPAEDVDGDAFAAVDNAATRVARLIDRALDRERDGGALLIPSATPRPKR